MSLNVAHEGIANIIFMVYPLPVILHIVSEKN